MVRGEALELAKGGAGSAQLSCGRARLERLESNVALLYWGHDQPKELYCLGNRCEAPTM